MVMHRNQTFEGKPPIKNQTASRTTLKLYTATEDEVRDKKKKKVLLQMSYISKLKT